jgi:ubiquinol-cytochrome c reductase cytochrome c subunit
MRVGPKPMPVFSPSDMSYQQMSAIAHYVQYLHRPANPGGLPISHFGPVSEGFIGVILGFGVLWFATRMIGNRG